MKKKLSKISLLLSGIALSFGLLVGIKPSSVTPVNAETTTTRCGVEAEWEEWNDSISLPKHGYYYLTTDVKLSKSATIVLNCHLDLNGKTITFENADEQATIIVSRSKLYLYDSLEEGKITTDSDITSARAVYIEANSEFNMYGGTISGFSSKDEGGGVLLSSRGVFNMYGGCIDNCYSSRQGGGVTLQPFSTFNMHGGTIQNCNSNLGGGVYARGTFDMNGGTIQNCTAENGGGVYESNIFNMHGGTIQNCTASSKGGAAFSSNIFNMHGGTIQNCNSETGGGVFAQGTFDMNGGTIQNCTADAMGGGVRLNGTLTVGGGYIGKNQSEIGSGINKNINGTFNLNSGRFYTKNTYYDVSISGESTITFDLNGGEGDTSPLAAIWNSTFVETVSVPTREHYYFDGYYNAKEGGDKYFDSYGEVVERGDEGFEWDYVGPVTLYAHWIGDPYTVTLDAQGGTGGSESVVANYDGNMPEAEMPTKEGYIFLGFFDETLGGNQYYNADGSSARKWDKLSEGTLYAQWLSFLEDFAYQLIKLTDGFCESNIDETTQNNLKASFDKLSEENQSIFKTTEVQIPYVDSDIVVNAKTRYCYMISERGYDDFLGIFTEDELKALKSRGNAISLFDDSKENSSTILVISLIIIGFITLSGYIVLKKKENRQ